MLAVHAAAGGVGRKLVAIANFNANAKPEIDIARRVVAVLEADLINGDLFNVVRSNIYVNANALPDFGLWRIRRVDALVVGSVQQQSQTMKIEFRMWDVMAGKQITGAMHIVERENWVPVVHVISDAVTSALRG